MTNLPVTKLDFSEEEKKQIKEVFDRTIGEALKNYRVLDENGVTELDYMPVEGPIQ